MSAERKIGPYVLERPVARWTLAERFIASSPDQDGPLLLDRFWPELACLERIEEERAAIHSWTRIDHPAIPKVLEVQGDPDAGYVVGEPFEGRALESLLQRQRQTGGPLPRRLVIELGLQLAQALTVIHETTDEEGWSLGLVHGGVNPSRIILDKRGRVRLIGGWATRLEGRLSWSQPPRAVVYQAPERVWGMSPPTPRSDLFSLGVVLFEAWTLRRFEGNEQSGPATLRRILRRAIEPAFEGDESRGDMEEIIQALLCHDPEARPRDAREVEISLANVLAARFEDARPAETTPAPPAPAAPTPKDDVDPPSVEIPRGSLPSMTEDANPDMRATTLLEKNTVDALVQHSVDGGEDDDAAPVTEELEDAASFGGEVSPEERPRADAPAPEPVVSLLGDDPAAADAAMDDEDIAATDLDGPPPAAPKLAPADAISEAPPPVRPKAPPPGPSPKAEAADEGVAPELPTVAPELPTVAPSADAPAPKAGAPAPKAGGPDLDAIGEPDPNPVTYTQEQEAISPLVLQQELDAGPLWGFLVHREGSIDERRYALTGAGITLGRSSDNNYQILREAKASRRHCEIKRDGERILVQDRRSTNGTYVNGQPVKEFEVKGGEKITIGYTTLKVLLVDAEGNEIGRAQAREMIARDEGKPLPKAFLTRYQRTDKEQVIPIVGEVFMIGRSKDMDLTLKDKKVAPSHCQIRVEGNHYVIEDHLSEHGSLVNGFLIDQVILEGNEELQFGDQIFRFEVMI